MHTLVQINVVANSGSTGHIAEELGRLAIAAGWRSYIAYGRWACPSQSELIRIGSKTDILYHWIKSHFFDLHGLGSRRATKKLIAQIEQIKPDIIHLHNIHGYYLNYKLLFDYFRIAKIPIVWSLHDCWSMTGHCAHFQNIGCHKWQTGCHKCPNLNDYPKSTMIDHSKANYFLKKQLFTSIDELTLIPVCNWLDGIVNQSFFSNTNRKVIINGINLGRFSPQNNKKEVCATLDINNKYIILAVATTWSRTKGLLDILTLSKKLSEEDVIVLVGVTKKQKHKLPNRIVGIEKTENIQQLVELYSAADVFINPTYQDTLPTVNIEALACGTPVITYDTGGSADIIDNKTGLLVKRGDINGLLKSIHLIKEKGKSIYIASCRERAVQMFDKDSRYQDYFDLYNSLLK